MRSATRFVRILRYLGAEESRNTEGKRHECDGALSSALDSFAAQVAAHEIGEVLLAVSVAPSVAFHDRRVRSAEIENILASLLLVAPIDKNYTGGVLTARGLRDTVGADGRLLVDGPLGMVSRGIAAPGIGHCFLETRAASVAASTCQSAVISQAIRDFFLALKLGGLPGLGVNDLVSVMGRDIVNAVGADGLRWASGGASDGRVRSGRAAAFGGCVVAEPVAHISTSLCVGQE